MTLEEASANLQNAMQDYASARKSLSHHRGLAKHGIANELVSAVAIEHSAFHRLERAQAAYAALQPASTTAPVQKPVVASAKIAPTVAPDAAASTTGSFDLLGHLNDRCAEAENRVWSRLGFPPVRRS